MQVEHVEVAGEVQVAVVVGRGFVTHGGKAFGRTIEAGAEVRQDQVGQTAVFGEAGHIGRAAVQVLGAHALEHGFGVGAFMHEELGAGTGLGEEGGHGVVACHHGAQMPLFVQAHGVGPDALALPLHFAALLQGLPQRAAGQAQASQGLAVEPRPVLDLFDAVGVAGHTMGQRVAGDVQVVARDHGVVRLHGVDMQRVGQAEVAAAFGGGHPVQHGLGGDQGERLGAVVHGAARQQPRQAVAVVAVGMRDEDGVQVVHRQRRTQDLVLGGLAAVDEQPGFARAGLDGQSRDVAPARGDTGRGAEKGELEHGNVRQDIRLTTIVKAIYSQG